jgi:molybdopterin converting factor small subunit
VGVFLKKQDKMKKISILAFGMVAEKMGRRAWALETDRAGSVGELRAYLEAEVPSLCGLPFSVAVNRETAPDDAPIPDGAEVALLPPFSGG